MSQTTSVKVRRTSNGAYRIFFFTQEASGRSYGGRIITTASTAEEAVRVQNREAWMRGMTIIPFYG